MESNPADVKEDALEALYEKHLKKKALQKEKEESGVQIDPVDALPVKTLDGKLYYRTLTKTSTLSELDDEEAGSTDKGIVRLTKPERRAKLKKQRKEEKKLGKELEKVEEMQQTPQAAVLAEVKEDLTAEEAFESKKQKLAELGMALLANPEPNITSLKEMLQISKDNDHAIAKLGVLSMLAVFKDIIPGYRIRLPTERELEMKVSKDVKKMWFYESTLLSAYKNSKNKIQYQLQTGVTSYVLGGFIQDTIRLEFNTVTCSTYLAAFMIPMASSTLNFQESLLGVVVRNIGSSDDVISFQSKAGLPPQPSFGATFASPQTSAQVFIPSEDYICELVSIKACISESRQGQRQEQDCEKYDIIEEKLMSKVEKAAKAHLVVAALIATACDLCSSYDRAWRFCIWPRR
ncbi:hypothetical protein SO802_010674 [Lithocarpus litseifolius]|uniref:Nucleolar complex-associated protein 3 N-terminal domain-containing protein n=1 Tax=Lithocarpus litseifolius TaxID=425828 RepID=A0AAW2DEV3_9ROSI